MTLSQAQAELAALNAACLSAAQNGGISTYVVNGRTVTRDLKWLSEQRRQLEMIVARLQSGMFSVARFRDPE